MGLHCLSRPVCLKTQDHYGDSFIFRQFNTMVELGCGRGYVSRHMLKETVKTIYQCELSEKLLVCNSHRNAHNMDQTCGTGNL